MYTTLLLHSIVVFYMSEWAKVLNFFYLESISNTLLKRSPSPSLASTSLQSENKQRESKSCVLVRVAFHFVQIFVPFVFCFILVLIFIRFSYWQSLQFSERCLLFCLRGHTRNQNIHLHFMNSFCLGTMWRYQRAIMKSILKSCISLLCQNTVSCQDLLLLNTCRMNCPDTSM